MFPGHEEGRPGSTSGAALTGLEEVRTYAPPSVPGGAQVVPRPSAVALSHAGPSCDCGDWARGYGARAAEVAARARAEGHAAGLAEGLAAGPTHPAVAESVARMFDGWDGAAAAHARSVTTFRRWHTAAREEVAA